MGALDTHLNWQLVNEFDIRTYGQDMVAVVKLPEHVTAGGLVLKATG